MRTYPPLAREGLEFLGGPHQTTLQCTALHCAQQDRKRRERLKPDLVDPLHNMSSSPNYPSLQCSEGVRARSRGSERGREIELKKKHALRIQSTSRIYRLPRSSHCGFVAPNDIPNER